MEDAVKDDIVCIPIGKLNLHLFQKILNVINFILGENNYGIISIPPRIWYSFKGLSEKIVLAKHI